MKHKIFYNEQSRESIIHFPKNDTFIVIPHYHIGYDNNALYIINISNPGWMLDVEIGETPEECVLTYTADSSADDDFEPEEIIYTGEELLFHFCSTSIRRRKS